VTNTGGGVTIEAEGCQTALESFLSMLASDKPVAAQIHSIEPVVLEPVGYVAFEIRPSTSDGQITALILPDLAICPDCLRDIFEPTNRRYRYPFTNCTNCGPRFTIVRSLPYDRPNTSMAAFQMCDACLAEYEDPENRRFHAQPNACPVCGPTLAMVDRDGARISCSDIVAGAAEAVKSGKILALKGIGGFQLIVDATNDDAVRLLRERKRRLEKPFALMCTDEAMADQICAVNQTESRLLRSPQSPIVLMKRKSSGSVAESVAPGNPDLGVMLPYSPLHHLLMREIGGAVVATSGNLSDEPICIDNDEALAHLRDIADVFVMHNRPIVRHADDSVVRVGMGRELLLRRARGYAPLPVSVAESYPPILAVGAHQKVAVALAVGNQIVIGQHIGDVENDAAYAAFAKAASDLDSMYGAGATAVACDLHPDYLTSHFAQASGKRVIGVQHHYAHIASCMLDNRIEPPALGIAWDGSGYGLDGTIWGGEALLIGDSGFERFASLRPFRLPGGEAAIKEPRRTALAILLSIFGRSALEKDEIASISAFSSRDRNLVSTMLEHGLNCPVTTSAGRLFDAVASIAGIRQKVRHEGQAAMELEWMARSCDQPSGAYSLPLVPGAGRFLLDWEPLVQDILVDLKGRVALQLVAARFHRALAEGIGKIAISAGVEQVALSGGCFQNMLLVEQSVSRLRELGFKPFWHQRVPPNDGGICLGQIGAAGRLLSNELYALKGN
jgi:hydrogenase maturation protein HypF